MCAFRKRGNDIQDISGQKWTHRAQVSLQARLWPIVLMQEEETDLLGTLCVRKAVPKLQKLQRLASHTWTKITRLTFISCICICVLASTYMHTSHSRSHIYQSLYNSHRTVAPCLYIYLYDNRPRMLSDRAVGLTDCVGPMP